jgi:hypothetical protein
MEKHIVVELDEDGFVIGVHCPDETYVVHVLDKNAWNNGIGIDKSLDNYYKEVEKLIPTLKDCY